MTVADPYVHNYNKHNSDGYAAYKAIHSKENKRVKRWKKNHANFTTKMKEQNSSAKSQTHISKMHDPYHKYIILNLFIHRTAI